MLSNEQEATHGQLLELSRQANKTLAEQGVPQWLSIHVLGHRMHQVRFTACGHTLLNILEPFLAGDLASKSRLQAAFDLDFFQCVLADDLVGDAIADYREVVDINVTSNPDLKVTMDVLRPLASKLRGMPGVALGCVPQIDERMLVQY